MIKHTWTYSCDYCKEKVHEETQFSFFPSQSHALIPSSVPNSNRYGNWRTVDGLLVCPKHTVIVKDWDEEENNIVSPANMCRNCRGTNLTYDFDKAIYTCDCCKTEYARVLGKMVDGVRVHWLGVKIK